MSKIREDYSSSLFSKIENFVNGTEIEELGAVEAAAESASICEKNINTSKDVNGKYDRMIMEEAIQLRDMEDEYVLRQLRKKEEEAGNKGLKTFQTLYKIGAVCIAFAIILTLITAVSYLPEFGNASNPVNNEVPARYIEHGMQETGTVNVVTGMILNYRGFDTMGETHVLFIAATTVMILLLLTKKSLLNEDYAADRVLEPKNDVILQKVATFLIPVIAVFGIYVVLNGHISPGGGFSGGAILGAGMILYVGAFGFKKTERFFNEEVYKVAKVSALCCYVCCLSYYFYMGAHGFDNHIPLGTPGAIISSGLILFIDIFVGVEVACTMYAFYALFRRGEI